MHNQIDSLKRIQAMQREDRLAGERAMGTRTIPSRKDKQQDPRKERKEKRWERECWD